MHLFAISIYWTSISLLLLGLVVLTRNVILRSDRDYEAQFPWWARLALYLLILVAPTGLLSNLSVNIPWWVPFTLYLAGIAIPIIGLLSSLWLGVFRKTRERIKLAKGLLVVSIVPVLLVVGVYIDPANAIVY